MTTRWMFLCAAGCACCVASYPIQIGYIVGVPLPIAGFEKVGSGYVPFYSCLSPLLAILDFLTPFGMFKLFRGVTELARKKRGS